MLGILFDSLFAPRASERLVRALTHEDLKTLAFYDGTLPYHDPRVKALVWEIKYYANKKAAALAGEHFAETLVAVASETIGTPLLLPVPMHRTRRRERGHNQTEVLCKMALAHAKGFFEYEPRALSRARYTAPQQGLEKHVRLTNAAHSMKADPHRVAGRVCVVVDDVATTGATLKEATRALREAGARQVHCVTLARS